MWLVLTYLLMTILVLLVSVHLIIKMLFEKIIPYNTREAIVMSEAYRQVEDLDTSKKYLHLLKETIKRLQVNQTTPLLQTPLFEWNGVNSTCWIFEQYRATHIVHTYLILAARDLYHQQQFKEAKRLLETAVSLMKELIQLQWYKTPYVHSMPEMQVAYKVSRLFATKSLYFANMNAYKATPAAALLAYQLQEISNRLWKATANLDFENRLKAEYHYSVALTNTNFQKSLSHIVAAVSIVNKHYLTAPHIVELCNSKEESNRRVHYESVTSVSTPLLSVDDALSKC